METTKSVMFWIIVGLVAVSFVCSLVAKFTKGTTSEVFNWISIGCILATGVCLVAHDVIQ